MNGVPNKKIGELRVGSQFSMCGVMILPSWSSSHNKGTEKKKNGD